MNPSKKVTCPYCENPAERVKGREMYPGRPDLSERIFYRCVPCNAYVGTHKKTGVPFGSLANADLRDLRKAAHHSFDKLWQRKFNLNRTTMTRQDCRNAAYAWLGKEMKMIKSKCHIGMFDEDECRRVIELCKPYQ